MDIFIGKEFGKWIVIGPEAYDKHKAKTILCKCVCGTEKQVRIVSLITGISTQCKRCAYDSRESINIIGLKFGKYTVLEFAGRKYNSATMLKCQCDCGNIKIVNKTSLRSGAVTQCIKCAANQRNKARSKHNMINTNTYNVWRSMKRRCIDPKKKSYNRYGGRGIRVCERWLDSFENFLADMGEQPVGHQIDRINNDGNYEPGNCRWVTPKENANNRQKRKD